MSKIYLCYDVKGIQSFIFKIPKLKYIIGGSALIDEFDKEKMPELRGEAGVEHIFSGGGKGSFLCDSRDVAKSLKEKVIDIAHDIGLDIRFGEDNDFSQASQHADELYSFVPEIGNYPCSMSGLYPVEKENAVHSVIKRRLYDENNEKVFRYFEKRLVDAVLHPVIGKEVDFFHDVDTCSLGAEALGNRNRWAIIAMDGNDMGSQFRHQVSKDNPNRLEGQELINWIKNMSIALDNCSAKAAKAGIESVINLWAGSEKGQKIIQKHDKITLPIRPLVVGGDDVVVLCHCSYAMDFVEEVCRVFEETSKDTAKLWPATSGKLTISAGVLYCSVTVPLHTAIPYAEALLASAKTKGRKLNKDNKNQPSPACIDWEQVTDSIIDTPAAKRQRELFFKDGEIDKVVKLTKRPYSMVDLKDVEKLAAEYEKEIPRTVRHRVLPALIKNRSERFAFAAEVKKNHKNLFIHLNEFEMKKSRWEERDNELLTDVVDAILLLEESERMRRETVK